VGCAGAVDADGEGSFSTVGGSSARRGGDGVEAPDRGAVARRSGAVGKWNWIYERFARWAHDGTWDKLLAEVQRQSDAASSLDWMVSIDSTITRVHQHGATLPRGPGALPHHKNPWVEPPDHAIGRSRGGLTCEVHLVAEGLSVFASPIPHMRKARRRNLLATFRI
jgi:hypothetical protein